MTNRLRSFLLAGAVSLGLGAFAIGPAHALAVAIDPSDFVFIEGDGTFTIINNSTGWYIWGFGVVNIEGSHPSTSQPNWTASSCNNNCGGPGFLGSGFDYQNINGAQNPLSYDVGPGQSSSLFTFSLPTGSDPQFYVTNSDHVGGVYVIPSGSVPEPSTWAMLIAGFGFLGWRYARRQADGRRLINAT
jgi:hypothetical protein